MIEGMAQIVLHGVTLTLTFDPRPPNCSSSSSRSEHFYQIWRNSLFAFLKYGVHKSGMDGGATWKSNVSDHGCQDCCSDSTSCSCIIIPTNSCKNKESKNCDNFTLLCFLFPFSCVFSRLRGLHDGRQPPPCTLIHTTNSNQTQPQTYTPPRWRPPRNAKRLRLGANTLLTR